MKVKVDADKCLGCGVCEADAPEVFVLEDVAVVKVNPVPAEFEDAVRQAAEDCPEEAIIIED